MVLSLILFAVVVIAAVAGAAYFASQSVPTDVSADVPEVPYIAIDGDADIEAPVAAVEETVEEATAIVDDAKKKTGGVIAKVKRSSSVKAIGKAMSNLTK